MSFSKHSKAGTGQLPKSVKVRSTCNACQQAKIRCSHEKPSCRRCQKHKIDCIYSVSRRLGRPAKKKEARAGMDGEGSGCPTPEDLDRPERQKKRKPARRKSQVLEPSRAPGVRTPGKSDGDDPAHIPMPDVGAEAPALEADISSDGWLQELISAHVNGNQGPFPIDNPYGDIDLDDAFDVCPDEVAHMGGPFSLQSGDIYSGLVSDRAETNLERDLGLFQNTTHDQIEPQVMKEHQPTPWPCTQSPVVDTEPFLDPWHIDRVSSVNIFIDPANHYEPFQSPQASHGSSSYSAEDCTGSILPALDEVPNLGCDCYKQAMGELVRAGLKGASGIEEILTCQKELLLQTEAILQCRMCSQSEAQANLLMVIIVAIDSLLTTIDSMATLASCCVNDGVVPVGARGKHELGCGVKSHVDACPLFVGGLRIPTEDKSCFIRQVLQARLSMMWMTIRRVRVCMQQHLATASSRGRHLMIIETERRLQLTMMKLKMTGG